MALFKKTVPVKDYAYILNAKEPVVTEALKGEVAQSQNWFNKDVGEPHPFDFATTEGVYAKMGLVHGAVDKIVQSIWGAAISVKSENQKAADIINQWIHDTNFQWHGKKWTREGLVKGTGFMEVGTAPGRSIGAIKVLNANYMFIRRDTKGNVLGYAQYFGLQSNVFNQNQNQVFSPAEIVTWSYNMVGDNAYGYGIVQPNMQKINDLLGADKSMHTILRRKANSPMVATIGDKTKDLLPNQSTIDLFGEKMRYMQETTEWPVSDLVRLQVLDFGNVGDKFNFPVDHDMDLLFMGFQVPEVLMGRGNIPEGLAAVQMSAYERWIGGIQEDLSIKIEEKFFQPILQSNGLKAKVEIVWGLPSKEDTAQRLALLLQVTNSLNISEELRAAAEQEMAALLDLHVEVPPADERKKEEEEEQPKVPQERYEGELVEIKEA